MPSKTFVISILPRFLENYNLASFSKLIPSPPFVFILLIFEDTLTLIESSDVGCEAFHFGLADV
jgi:hypothetical protein